MKATTLTIATLFIPAMLGAQVSGQAQATSRTTVKAPSATAEARTAANGELRVPKGFSAEGKAKLEAMYAEAKEHEVPREPMAHRVAEGETKGASETAILASAGKVKVNMEETHEAMVKGGRAHPSAAESERGAMLMEHGVTSVQIEAMAKNTPSDRSLVVAFDVLGRLAARGVPVTQAIAQVQAKLDARASDATLIAMVGKATSGVSMGAGPGTNASATGNANANAAAGVTATVNGAANATTKGATAGVTGAVTGAVKKP